MTGAELVDRLRSTRRPRPRRSTGRSASSTTWAWSSTPTAPTRREEFHVRPAEAHGHLHCSACGSSWEISPRTPPRPWVPSAIGSDSRSTCPTSKSAGPALSAHRPRVERQGDPRRPSLETGEAGDPNPRRAPRGASRRTPRARRSGRTRRRGTRRGRSGRSTGSCRAARRPPRRRGWPSRPPTLAGGEDDPRRGASQRVEVGLVVRAGDDVLAEHHVGPRAVVLGRHPEHRRIGRRLLGDVVGGNGPRWLTTAMKWAMPAPQPLRW